MANKTKQNNIRIPHALTKVLLMRFQITGYSLSTTDTYNRFLINAPELYINFVILPTIFIRLKAKKTKTTRYKYTSLFNGVINFV